MSRSLTTLDRAQAPTQKSTAHAWAKRAIVAYRRASAARTIATDLKCAALLVEAEDHRGEALEHAALVGDRGRTVARVQRSMDAARRKAWAK